MNAPFIQENTAADSAVPDPHRDESERGASKGVTEAVHLLKDKKATNQLCQLQVYLYSAVWGFFFRPVGCMSLRHICNIRLK